MEIKIKPRSQQFDEILSPYTPYTSKIAFKKDFFIQSRQEDIRNYYDFYPKVRLDPLSPSAEADTGQSSRPNSSNPPTRTESSKSSTNDSSKTQKYSSTKSTS